MKKLLILLLLIGSAFAQTDSRQTGTVTTSSSVVQTGLNNYPVALITVNGTYAGVTINFELSDDNTNWYSATCTRTDALGTQETSEAVTNNATRAWQCVVTGAQSVRVRASAYTSGTMNVAIVQSKNSIVARSNAAGGGLPSGLTFVAPTLTVSAAGSGNGQLALSGNTSGTATLTAPAVAGTVTNPVVSTNAIQVPNGAAATPGLVFAGNAGSGVSLGGSGEVILSSGTVATASVFNSGITLAAAKTLTTPLYATSTNCANAGGTCAAAAAGAVTIAAAATTVTVATTAVTANSEIMLTWDSSLGTRLSVTCNTTPTQLAVTARTAATSFVITTTAPVTNPACITYQIIN